MSTFTDSLNNIRERRKLNIAELASACGYDVGTVYKWVKGSHLPKQWQSLETMTENLNLSEYERQELKQAYERTRLGEETYACCQKVMNILDIIQKRGKEYSSTSLKGIVESVSLKPLPEMMEFNNKTDIMNCIQNVLTYIVVNNKEKICFKIQTDHQDIFMLIRMHMARLEKCNLEEIVTFVNGHGTDIYNLNILEGLIDFLIQKHPIQVYSLEQGLWERKENDNWIITDDFAVEFADDFSRGMITTNPKLVAYFQKNYEEVKQKSVVLGKVYCKNPQDFLAESIEEGCGGVMEYMPCIGPCLTRDILQNQILENIPGRDELIDRILIYNRSVMDGAFKKTINFFQREGFIDFFERGRVEIFPYEVYGQIPCDVCCDIMQNAIDHTRSGRMNFCMMKEEWPIEFENIYIECIAKKVVRIDVHFEGGQKEQIELYFDSICRAFGKFINYLQESGYAYTKQETADYMQSVVDEYRRFGRKRSGICMKMSR